MPWVNVVANPICQHADGLKQALAAIAGVAGATAVVAWVGPAIIGPLATTCGKDPAQCEEVVGEAELETLTVAEGEALGSVDEVLAELQAGRTPPNLEVATELELNEVFSDLTAGGRQVSLPTYAGEMFELPDGTRVGLRATSASGGPTIDVFKSDGTYVTVHLP